MKKSLAAVIFVIGLFTLVFTLSSMNSLLIASEALNSLEEPALQPYVSSTADFLLFGWVWADLTAASSLIVMWLGLSNIRRKAGKK